MTSRILHHAWLRSKRGGKDLKEERLTTEVFVTGSGSVFLSISIVQADKTT
jgi:hypothetical protein